MKTLFFSGYRRSDGRIGIRNHVVVISTISCANHVASKIAQRTGAIAIIHDTGCLQFGDDRAMTARCIFGAGQNPNVGAVLFVGLGCEQTPTKDFSQSITGKPARHLYIQESGGTSGAIKDGCAAIEELTRQVNGQAREQFEVSHLSVAVKCGGSDFTTAIASNPAVGVAADMLVEAGGAVFLTETTGFPGSEHILARRAVSREVGKQIYAIVDFYRDEMKSHFNRSPSDGNPAPGNIAGGITTLVEKSYGTIMKGGTTPIQGVLKYGEDVFGKRGLWIMDTPGHDVFSVSGPASGGCHADWFTTGRGSPLGNAIMPVIKICGNPETYCRMEENMDVNAGLIMTGAKSMQKVGEEIFASLIRVASGELTKAEILGHQEFTIPRIGSTL